MRNKINQLTRSDQTDRICSSLWQWIIMINGIMCILHGLHHARCPRDMPRIARDLLVLLPVLSGSVYNILQWSVANYCHYRIRAVPKIILMGGGRQTRFCPRVEGFATSMSWVWWGGGGCTPRGGGSWYLVCPGDGGGELTHPAVHPPP
jgi:hypothetical protein